HTVWTDGGGLRLSEPFSRLEQCGWANILDEGKTEEYKCRLANIMAVRHRYPMMGGERERSSNLRLSCWWVRLFGIQSSRLRLQIAVQITRVIVSDAQSRHEDARVPFHESHCHRI